MTDEVSEAAQGLPAEAQGAEEAAEAAEALEAVDGAVAVAVAAGPAALGIVRTPTGCADVDAGLERLADADHLTADGHVEVYEDVHRGLRDALTALDAPTGPRPYENRS